jgi:nucleoside-diphosphate-sugar epimerase
MLNSFLITGGLGFLGREITQTLSQRFYLKTLGRSAGNDFVCDLASNSPSIPNSFDVVIHNAGKAHSVPKSKEEEEEFYLVNYTGTLNLLNGLEKSNRIPKSLVYISSVAVYGDEVGDLLDEQTPLKATDAYGKSKRLTEEAVIGWGRKNSVTIGILRLPIIVGPNPPGNLRKMIKAIQSGYYFQIGKAPVRRSMVLASDVAELIPVLAKVGGIFNLTDGRHPSFKELGTVMSKKLGVKIPKTLPLWLGESLAKAGDFGERLLGRELPFNSKTLSKMTSSLTFSDERATQELNWKPHSVLSYLNDVSKSQLTP